jgi:hypothetical protein
LLCSLGKQRRKISRLQPVATADPLQCSACRMRITLCFRVLVGVLWRIKGITTGNKASLLFAVSLFNDRQSMEC